MLPFATSGHSEMVFIIRHDMYSLTNPGASSRILEVYIKEDDFIDIPMSARAKGKNRKRKVYANH